MIEKVAVEIKNVSKKYSRHGIRTGKFLKWINLHLIKQETFFALKNINLTICKGEILGIMGPNGSGKSTLLKLISQITSPSDGIIEITGKVASILEIGIGFQPELSGYENIFLSGYMYGLSKKKIQQNVDNIVDMFGFPDFIHTPVKNYSSGMYMRLAFSIVCHIEADIYLFDEVLSVGDEKFQSIAINEIRKIKEKGATVCIVTHLHKNISDLCDKALLLNKGEVVSYGGAYDVLTAYAGLFFNNNKTNENFHFEINSKQLLLKKNLFLKTNDFEFNAENICVRNELSEEKILFTEQKLEVEIQFNLITFIQLKVGIFIKDHLDTIITSHLRDFEPNKYLEKYKMLVRFEAHTFNPSILKLDLVVLMNNSLAQSYSEAIKVKICSRNKYDIIVPGYINTKAVSEIVTT